jgi:hypothetical protein
MRRDCIHCGNLDFMLQVCSQQKTHVPEDCKVLMLSPALYTHTHTHMHTILQQDLALFLFLFCLETCESSSGIVAD